MKHVTITIRLDLPDDWTAARMNELGAQFAASIEKATKLRINEVLDEMYHEAYDEDGGEIELP